MNIVPFELDLYQLKDLMAAFRERRSIIIFWMQVAKIVCSYVKPADIQIRGKMFVCTDKMRRVFVVSDARTFSMSLPFSIKSVDGLNVCTLKSGIELTNKVSSEVIAVLSTTESFSNSALLGFVDNLIDVSDDPDTLWSVLSELMSADDGYVRLDHDPINEDGHEHPLNHVDVFFSQSATFKLGLAERIDIQALTDILNLKTACHYVVGHDRLR